MSSRWPKVCRWPQLSSACVASSVPPIEPSPSPTTSCMKRLKKTLWRASSTCCVARKYFCSSSGAASMYGLSVSATVSSPWKKSVNSHSAPRRCSGVMRSCQSMRSCEKSISVARQLPFSQRA